MLALAVLSLLAAGVQTAPDKGKWANLGVVDVHAHIGSFRGYNIGSDVLLQNLRNYGIKLALVSNIDGADIPETQNLNEIDANQAMAATARENLDVMRGLLWARPHDGNADNLARFLEGPYKGLFVGIKFHPEFNHFQADEPRVDPYMKLCEKYGIAAVFHCGRDGSNSSPASIYAVARRHPSVPVVLYHSGFFTSHQTAVQAVKESIRKHDSRLYLETAQVKPKDVLMMIREVGADHVLFGTDATYYGADHYGAYEDLIRLLQNTLTPEEFRKVVRENAEAVFSLPAGK